MTLYIDMDGVLADFDSHHAAVVGWRPDRTREVDWPAIRVAGRFFAGIPPMPDMRELWEAALPHSPVILTGVPPEIPEAAVEKREWVRRHLGPRVELVCCLSRDKALHARPGDILVDDWGKYRPLWEAAGGIWIAHRSAAESVRALREVLGRPATDTSVVG